MSTNYRKNGVQVAIFPFNPLNITQGENGSASHRGTLNIDFALSTKHFPIVAPCDCKCVDIFDPNANTRDFESLEPVLLANGEKSYISFSIAHDNNPVAKIGDTFKQGDIIAHSGTAGHVTGDHTHFNVARGQYKGHYKTSSGTWTMTNSIHIYDAFYLYNVIIIDGNGYPWKSISNLEDIQTSDTKKRRIKHVKNVIYQL